MRKNYIYAITLVVFSVLLWVGYYLYQENRPVSYYSGTFVEIPKEYFMETLEFCG